ncbi:hypothetical protein ELUCI_v1c02450 [Williamsoniiplasma lucivorax]|uniref:Uncharacterized protein n=1 Tax=Williamsoniiplasma lucivorax TaxID=209274 RepID=A0A2S5RF63_9MOLU|nr:hypothetical protein ELUCI_v1c02450 [Williamsoniiplasma lucivorax]
MSSIVGRKPIRVINYRCQNEDCKSFKNKVIHKSTFVLFECPTCQQKFTGKQVRNNKNRFYSNRPESSPIFSGAKKTKLKDLNKNKK